MAPRSLERALPWLAAPTSVLLTVALYELGVLGSAPRDDSSCDCTRELPIPTDEPARGGGELDGFDRPHPAARVDLRQASERIETLEAQNELLAERSVTGELSYYGMAQSELEAMARHCDVRTDYPTRLDEQSAEDLGLDPDERAAYQRAIEAFAADEAEHYRAIYRELVPDDPEADTLALADLRRALVRKVGRARKPGDDQLRRHVAEERAGMRSPPEDPAALSAYNRYNRLRYDAGERFAGRLEEELGGERAEELRRALAGWPGARTREWGCPEDED
ncbi:hypothetical protein G6O69_33805 [Pseudenhygromyxa sp. WMMC2535]|uniref:hypothetical protein n=1 Tax=Pseudenhygromyxa sp. WMMC2535 TaxID=2712867 RepID=UPI001554E749|nr:hypothetical protein [Pseudenhygromyxa sp. WMMC2535]NVB42845.1 hypothetical protein [Pseudenhygromyxa sp. WMMC2535]